MTIAAATCTSCYGEGVLATEQGPQPCPDCAGEGAPPPRRHLVEHRLGDIEQRLGGPGATARIDQADVRWLLHELRCSREALVRLLSRALDASPGDALASEVRYVANLALGYYDPRES
jgi:hypothetical protein